MRLNRRSLLQYRPRLLTIVLLIVIAVLLLLSNLSDEIRPRHQEAYRSAADLRFDVREADDRSKDDIVNAPCLNVSSGWPLIWRQYVVLPGFGLVAGEYYSRLRLIGNLLLWLAMLAGPVASCEWLLRRFRPQMRWGLRTMLAAVGLVAILCGWFSTASNLAAVQDEVIASDAIGNVWIERWGPDWLDFIGAGQFRRHIVGLSFFDEEESPDPKRQDVLTRTGQLSYLQYFDANVYRVTPALVNALRDTPRLRILSVEELCRRVPREKHDDAEWRDLIAAIGEMDQLEHLHLGGSPANNMDLRYLSALPHLRSFNLIDTEVTGAGLAELTSSKSIEEIAIANDMLSGIDSLATMKQLKVVHIDDAYYLREVVDSRSLEELAIGRDTTVHVAKCDFDICRRALAALRRSKPELVIDVNSERLYWPREGTPLADDKVISYLNELMVRQRVREWKSDNGRRDRDGSSLLRYETNGVGRGEQCLAGGAGRVCESHRPTASAASWKGSDNGGSQARPTPQPSGQNPYPRVLRRRREAAGHKGRDYRIHAA